ncbi:DNA ligase [Thiolapillus sp.]
MNKTRTFLIWLLLLFPLLVQGGEPQLLLLKKYRPGMDVNGWLMSEKLDGVRAYWDGHQLLTRRGKHIAAPHWFTKDLPPFALDGELWIARGSFEETLSVVSRDQPHAGWRRVSYNIFELPHAPGGLKARLGKLEDYLIRRPLEHVRIIPQAMCRNVEQLMKQLDAIVAAGGEGLVLRNPESPYESGRSPNAIKVKRFDDMEGRVIGYRPGKGRLQGMVGALWVEINGGKRFYIGSGLTDQERAMPPMIGSVITFKHQGFSGNGIPRFASFLRVREER